MALGAGSIAFVGYNGDGNDNIAFVALADIAAGTEIFFTDNAWNGSSFGTTESIFKWTASNAVAAGTVININSIGSGTATTNSGAVAFTSSANRGLSNDSEVVYAYIGTANSPTFLAAISNVGYGTSDGNLNGTGLTLWQTAVSLPGSGNDIGAYTGTRAGQTSYASYLSAINNAANWTTQNGSGDQSADGTSPDAPFPTSGFTVTAPVGQTVSFSPASVSVTEGNSGTQTMTFTVTRDGGTTGTLAFSGNFAAGTTNAADFGDTLPASTFNGTIAAGATSATFTITISGDALAEANESFTLTLTSASNPSATVTIGTASATGTITNDDGTLISSNSSTAQTLANNDHLTIASGVTLSGATPVTWNAGSTAPGSILDNFGTISGTDRAMYTTTSAVSGSLTINNAAGATITAVKDAIKIANLVSGENGTLTVNNDGTIRSTGTGSNVGQALDLDTVASSGVHVVINNSSTGLIQAAEADAIRPGSNATINNSGRIFGLGGNDAIDFQDVNTGGVVNNLARASIDGTRHGITAKQSITVTNAGSINGQLGSGINLDTAANVMSFVTNSGAITGHSGGATDGDGVDVDGLVTIENSGSIEARGTSTGGSLSEALAIGGGSVHNGASGAILSEQRAITVDNSDGGSAFAAITIVNEGLIKGGNGEAIGIVGDFADTLTNSGIIIGNVSLGGGADTLNNSGSIDSVSMGAGNDVINLSADSMIGNIDGGSGTDTINLSGDGSLGRITGIETIKLNDGSWNIGEDGAAVVLEGGAQTLSIASGAIGDGAFTGTIFGLGTEDRIQLNDVTATSATLGAGNLLTVVTTSGPITLQLDPAQNFAGMAFNVESDGNGGSYLTYEAAPVAAPLGAGSIAFVGFNADGTDGVAFVALADIAAGTVIHFTDNAWNGSAFASNESVWSWAATSDVAAGTVISMEGLAAGATTTTNIGTVNFDNATARDIADTNEVVYAYVGDATAPTFLTAMTNSSFGNVTRGTLDNTGLTSGVDAVILRSSADVTVYTGDTSSKVDFSEYKLLINSNANWASQIGNGDQSHDGIGPDVPFSTTPFSIDPNAQRVEFANATFEVAEGNNGTTLVTFTLVRSGSMAGTVNFTAALALAQLPAPTMYADTADFVNGSQNFSGSFADGQSTATVTVEIAADTVWELDELFWVNITNVSNATGTVYLGTNWAVETKIVNDDPIQFVGFAENSWTVTQNEGAAGETHTYSFVVERSGIGGTVGDVTFSGTVVHNSTTAEDFGGIAPLTFSGTILAGQGSGIVTITTTGDGLLEGDEVFTLVLESLSSSDPGMTLYLNQNTAQGVIVNDDPLHIGAGQTVVSPLTIGDGDHLVIDAGGVLAPTTLEFPVITWIGGTSSVENHGRITAPTFVNALAGNQINGNLTFDNLEGAVTEGMFQLRYLGDGSSVTVNNAGTMANFDTKDSTAPTTINNAATGVIAGQSAFDDVMRLGSNTTLNNAGRIVSPDDAGNGGGGDAVDLATAVNDVVNNLAGGYIEGSRHGITGARAITIVNEVGASLIGRNGSGINIDNESLTHGVVTVTNRGTIEGRSAVYDDSDGDAIDADGLLALDNYGAIRGLGANGYHNGGPNVSEALAIGGGTVNNYADATIYGYGRALQVDNSDNGPALAATTIVNHGSIQGDGHGPEGVDPADAAQFDLRGNEAINLVGDWADSLTNTGTVIGGVAMGGGNDTLINSGTMTATGGSAINLGDGDDTLTLQSGSLIAGAILGGAGNDTVKLNGTGTNALGATTGFESLVVQEGTWSVAASDYTSVTIEDGGTVTSAITLNGSDELTIAAGGRLTNATAITWAGGGNAIVDNAGLIEASTRVFNTVVNATGSFTFNNETGGTVRGTLTPQQRADANATVTINNSGIMESSGRVIDFQNLVSGGAHATINNLVGGTIRQTGSDTDVIRPGQNTVVNNWGMITTAAGFAGGGDLIDYQSSTGGQVHNYAGGWMEASRHAVTGDHAVTVINEGTMIGRNGSAVNIDNDGSEADKVFITNRGTMEGRSAELSDSDGDAVDVDGLVQVLNYGRIAGLGAEGYHDGEPNVSEGIAIGGGTILNYGANAEIYGYGRAIQVDNSSNSNALGKTLINNEGLIKGDGQGPEGVLPADAARFDLRGNEAINLVGDYDDEILNQSTGRIVGGVSMGGGNDHLQSLGSFTATGGSAIDMGAGNDTVYFYTGTTVQGTVLLGAGDDLLLSTAGSGFVIDAGDGNDQIYLDSNYSGNDTLAGGIGDDYIYAGSGDDQIDGGDGNDILSGEGGNDVITGGLGNDVIYGGAGNDHIFAGAGDTVEGGADDDFIEVEAGPGAVVSIDGGEGNDTVINQGTIQGVNGVAVDLGAGDDVVVNFIGGVIQGEIRLGSGDDQFFGNESAENVDGGEGNDLLIGGGGNDTLTGGDGGDIYSYVLGDGSDIVAEGSGVAGDVDLLMFDEVELAGATMQKHGSDVEIVLTNGDVITLKDQLAGGGVENIVFSDGAILDRGAIEAELVNRGPVGADDLLGAVAEDAPSFLISFADLLGNDTDADLDVLSITELTDVIGGTAVIEAGGIRFTPDANFHGDASFAYTVSDGHGGTSQATASFGITSVNDAPTVTTPIAVTTAEDVAITGQIIASDIEGDTLTYVVKPEAGAAHGAVAIDANGNWTYTPDANYNGPDSFTVLVSDGQATVEAVVTVGVTAVNDGPIAVNDTLAAVAEDAPSFLISFASLLGNDTDVDHDVLTITDISSPVGGTFTIEAGGIRYTPTANYNGPVSFAYTVTDGRGGTSQATASFTVTAVNDGPAVVTPVAVVTNEDTAVTGQIIASDIDGDTLTYVVKPEAGAAHGIVTIDANGNWTYTPSGNYNGPDSFTVLVSDGQATVEAVVTVGITPVNDGPVASDDTLAAVAEDAPSFLISFADLLGNDTDVDHDALSITGLADVVGGTAVIEGNNIRFTPGANYNGDASFAYTVSDGHGGTSQATASFGITAVNDTPTVTTPVAVTTAEDVAVTGQIIASDIEGDSLTYVVKPEAGAAHGIVTINANGRWVYTPDANYHGSDSFTVLVSDGHATVEALVAVGIMSVNDAPVAVADHGTVDENETKLFNVIGNDTDVDGGILSLSGFSVTGVSDIGLDNAHAQTAFSIQNGQLAFNPGTLFDALNDGDAATVTISYTVKDADGASSTANFVLTVNGDTDGNVIVGTNGADPLFGTGGVDIISANDGNDTIFGRGGNDVIDAGNGNDTVFGGAGNDVIDGGAGKDTLMGDAGNDVLAGGQGNDLLYGGDGNDTFVFHAGEGRDTVYDFQAGACGGDVIQLDASMFDDFNDLMQSSAVTDTAIGVQIGYGDGSTITLIGVDKAHLAIDDFRFA